MSEIRSALDPKLRNQSLDLLSTTDFKILDNDPSVPKTSSADHNDAVYFAHDRENTSSTMVDLFKSVMVDENSEPRTDENGHLLYEIGLNPNCLPSKFFYSLIKIQTYLPI